MPATPADFAIFDDYLDGPADHPVGVAVSGGGDSVALLYALHLWGKRRLEVFCVDHDLNPASGEWTQSVRIHADRTGAGFTALHWAGPKPKTGLSAAARQARHALIADAARQNGIRVVCLAHTQDDIAEAKLMAQEGSNVGAPAIWAPSPAWPQGRGVFLFRPFLHQRRRALRDWLTAQAIGWIDDPANENPASLRARARRKLADFEPYETVMSHAPSPADLPQLIRDTDTLGALGMIVFDGAVFDALPKAIARRRLSAAAVSAGGGNLLPSSESVARLHDTLSGDAVATLSGARIQRVGGRIEIVREAGEFARHGLLPTELRADSDTMWDGRFSLRSDRPGRVGPMLDIRPDLDDRDRTALKAFPAALRTVLPAVEFEDGRKALPWDRHGTEFACWVLPRFLAASGAFSRESDLCDAAPKPL